MLAEAIGHEVSRYVADRTRVNGWEKELITIADGYCKSNQSWRELLRD